MPLCTVCGDHEGEVYFGTFEMPIDGTGEDVLIEPPEENEWGIGVFEWTGETEEYEYWECRECYEDTTYCLLCNGPETCVCEAQNDESIPPEEWPDRPIDDVFDP